MTKKGGTMKNFANESSASLRLQMETKLRALKEILRLPPPPLPPNSYQTYLPPDVPRYNELFLRLKISFLRNFHY